MNIDNNIGALPARNGQSAWFGDKAERISGEWVKDNLLVDDPTCHACPVACKKEVEIKAGPDAASIAKMIDLVNDYGLDAIEMGDLLAMYMEASQRAYTNGTGGLQWGDYLGMVKVIHKIALREGVGDILAEGTQRAAEHFGHPELAMTSKGMGIPAYDPRGLKGMGLGYATSNRGACHLRGYSPASELGLIPLKTDPLAWKGKGELLKLLQDLHAFSDSLDLCKFSAFAEGADEYAAQYSAMTGIPYTADEVLKAGERIYNLERYYNNLIGFREGSDTLPKRFLEEPSTAPGSTGHVCELDLMLEEYYAARGWVNGVVPQSKLIELEILEGEKV
jgi:aldehyde:ferredoxin oxidoreductase